MRLLIFLLLATIIYDSWSLPDKSSGSTSSSMTTTYPIGLILDMGSSVGRAGYNCISMALSEFYAKHSHYKTRLVLHTRDSKGKPLDALFSGIFFSFYFNFPGSPHIKLYVCFFKDIL